MTSGAMRRVAGRCGHALRVGMALAGFLALAAPATAQTHEIYFSFANLRPTGETVTGHIINQGRFQDIPNNNAREIISPFVTEGLRPSTAHYDVRITKQGDTSQQYCDYHAVANYLSNGNWSCTVQRESSGLGATCTSRIAPYGGGVRPCGYEFDVK